MEPNALLFFRDRCLKELENRFGKRDKSFRLGGIAISDDGIPCTLLRAQTNIIDILLSEENLVPTRIRIAMWQLAHECVHLIDPSFPAGASVLEEGMATWFQNVMVKGIPVGLPSYEEAERLVAPMMESGDLQRAVSDLRAGGTRISDISSEQLMAHVTTIDDATAVALTSPFVRE